MQLFQKSDVAKLKKLMQLQAHQLQRSHCLKTKTAVGSFSLYIYKDLSSINTLNILHA